MGAVSPVPGKIKWSNAVVLKLRRFGHALPALALRQQPLLLHNSSTTIFRSMLFPHVQHYSYCCGRKACLNNVRAHIHTYVA